jgi:glucosamine-6-phosphate deaminase
VRYILTDAVIQGPVSPHAVTPGLATIMAAREVVVLVSGSGKREPLRQLLAGVATTDVPASVLSGHPNCAILTDRGARSG